MRATWLTAAVLSAFAAFPAAAQTGSAASPQTEGAASKPPRRSLAHMATSHAQIARRMAGRPGEATTGQGGEAAAPNPKLAAASKAADEAVVNDPTVREMLNGSMSKPPSLAGGAPALPSSTPPP